MSEKKEIQKHNKLTGFSGMSNFYMVLPFQREMIKTMRLSLRVVCRWPFKSEPVFLKKTH